MKIRPYSAAIMCFLVVVYFASFSKLFFTVNLINLMTRSLEWPTAQSLLNTKLFIMNRLVGNSAIAKPFGVDTCERAAARQAFAARSKDWPCANFAADHLFGLDFEVTNGTTCSNITSGSVQIKPRPGTKHRMSERVDDMLRQYLDRTSRDMKQMFRAGTDGKPVPVNDNSMIERKFLVYVPLEGLGNRFRSMMSCFLLAILTDRIFMIDWRRNFLWSDIVRNPFEYDWDFSNYGSSIAADRPADWLTSLTMQTPRRKVKPYRVSTETWCLDVVWSACNQASRLLSEFIKNDISSTVEADVLTILSPMALESHILQNPFLRSRFSKLLDHSIQFDPWYDATLRVLQVQFFNFLILPSHAIAKKLQLDPNRGSKLQTGIHLRSLLLPRPKINTFMSSFLQQLPSNSTTPSIYVSADADDLKQSIVSQCKRQCVTQPARVVHSNDPLPGGMQSDAYIAVMEDIVAVSATPSKIMTCGSTFSEAIFLMSYRYLALRHHEFVYVHDSGVFNVTNSPDLAKFTKWS
jgi:hypothetical protein